jgi:hypothetical protein
MGDAWGTEAFSNANWGARPGTVALALIVSREATVNPASDEESARGAVRRGVGADVLLVSAPKGLRGSKPKRIPPASTGARRPRVGVRVIETQRGRVCSASASTARRSRSYAFAV